MGCGACAGACPISGADTMDPRKLVRMAALDMEEELIALDWPWKCTLCGRCEQACPVGVTIVQLIRTLRANRSREMIPGAIQLGVNTCLEQGNNIGIPTEDFINIFQTVDEKIQAETRTDFSTPIEMRGARLLVTINSKIPFIEPEALLPWWRIFHAAGESWTIPASNWEAVNWAYFSADDDATKTIVGRIVDNLQRLHCSGLLLPECGHAAHATLSGLRRWFPDILKQYTIYSTLGLLREYLADNRLQINKEFFYERTTYHDPCYYGRQNETTSNEDLGEIGRTITTLCCPNFVEMSPNRANGYCCGAGGGTMATPFAAERIFHGRIKARQIKESGAKLVVTPCPTCRDQLQVVLNREFGLNVEVKFPWQLLSEALVLQADQTD